MYTLGMTKAEKREALEAATLGQLAQQALKRAQSTDDTREKFRQISVYAMQSTEWLLNWAHTSTISIPWLPEYVAVRNRWHSIPTWLHWLFPRLRERYEALLLEQQQVTLNTVIEWGKSRIAEKESNA